MPAAVPRLLAALTVVTLAGCDLPFARGCDAYAAPAVSVTVVDSLSGGVVDGPDLLIVARDGAFADTADARFGGLAHERQGTYTVTVTHPQYATWERRGVRVRKQGCHVETAALTARLRRSQ